MPAFTGKETAQIIQNYIVSISNDLEISLKYSDAAVAFKSDVDKQLADFKKQVSEEQTELNKALSKAIKDIADQTTKLREAVYNDITGNPWSVIFSDLNGISLTKGNFNKTEQRIEC